MGISAFSLRSFCKISSVLGSLDRSEPLFLPPVSVGGSLCDITGESSTSEGGGINRQQIIYVCRISFYPINLLTGTKFSNFTTFCIFSALV